MMSTEEGPSSPYSHNQKGDALDKQEKKSAGGLEKSWPLTKLEIGKSDCDSGVGSSDSSDSMCDVKDSFKEAIMNLKALNGDGDNRTKEDENVGENQDVKIAVKNGLDDHTNGKSGGIAEIVSCNDDKLTDERPVEVSESGQVEQPSQEPTENPSDQQSENQLEPEKSEASVASSATCAEEISQDDETEPKKDHIEIVDSDNDACDDEIMILSEKSEAVTEKDEQSRDSESGGSPNPLTIGDRVKKSVRDIMSKLKHGPEFNKLLVKPKQEDANDAEPSPEPSTAEKSKVLPQSPRTGNLFENLTVIGARASEEKKVEEDEKKVEEDEDKKDNVTEQNDSKNSVEILDSQESDVELIEDNETDKKDEAILFDEDKPATTKSSGISSAITDIKKGKDEVLDSKSVLSSADSTDCKDNIKQEVKPNIKLEVKPNLKLEVKPNIKLEVKPNIKLEVKPKVEEADGSCDKPMEIDDDDDKDVEKKQNYMKSEPVKIEDSSDIRPASRNDRKRSQEDPAANSGAPPKRSRLDMVIGKLGSQIGISPDTIKTDSSDEDSRLCSDTSEKSEDNMSSVSDEEDDKTSQSSTKTIRLSGKELEALVRSKVASYLKAHRDGKLEALKTKVEELQRANESWKTQAKDLQKQVLDLTVLQQRLEKRKAATAALRQITTRSVGIQADDSKTNFSTGLAMKQTKTPPKAAPIATPTTARVSVNAAPVANLTTMPVLASAGKTLITPSHSSAAVNQNSVTQLLSATAVPRSTSMASPVMATSIRSAQHITSPVSISNPLAASLTTVRSLLDNTKTIDTVSKLQTPFAGSNVIVVSSPTLPGQVASSVTVPKVIDLTSDEDSAKAPCVQGSKTVVVPVTSVSTLRPGMVQQQVIRGVNPINLQQPLQPGTSILLSSPGIVSPGSQNLTRPGGTFQIVTVASGSNLRPGTLLTVVPAGTTVSPQTTQIRTVVPSVLPIGKPAGTGNQTMPQLRPVTSVSQVSVTPTATRTTIQSQSVRPPPPLQSAPTASTGSTSSTQTTSASQPAPAKHPAALPTTPQNQPTKGIKGLMPPKPGLKISRVSQGIVLSWNMIVSEAHAEISSYQLFAYQESSAPPSTALWKKVGDVKALPLPMACTLTQFQEGNKYHFAVRAVDVNMRIGEFSDPSTIHLTPKS